MPSAAVLIEDAAVGTFEGFRAPPPGSPYQLYVGRQGIFTENGDVHGHEFLFRTGHEHTLRVDRWSAQAQDRATLKVLEATFTSAGLLTMAAETMVFVNFTRSFLVDDLSIPPLPSQLVIEVVESVRADAQVVAGIARLRDAGFKIALDDFVGLDSQCALLPYADYVKIDVRDLRTHGPALLDLAGRHGATLVAERIETPNSWDTCRALGFSLFQGNLMEAATVIERACAPASGWPVACARVSTQTAAPETEVVEAVELLALPALVVAATHAVAASGHRSRQALQA